MIVNIDPKNMPDPNSDTFWEDGLKKAIENTKNKQSYKDANWYDNYYHHLSMAGDVAHSAKIYVLEHYHLIDDWSDLQLKLYHNKGITKLGLYKKSERKEKSNLKKSKNYLSNLFEGMNDNRLPFVKLEKAVYDWSDTDFSITVDGNEYLWISDDSVIKIADYIERKLK